MFLPPRSPFGLIQEDLWPDEWKILVSCVMLNCTSRKQVEKVLPNFFNRWPDAKSVLKARESDLQSIIAPLGFKNRRTVLLKKLALEYSVGWKEIRDLPGVGEYAARAWEIFVKNEMGNVCPKDHALTKYWIWRNYMMKKNMQQQPVQKKQTISKRRKVKVDLSTLPDAIVNGQFIVPPQGKVFFERTLSGTTKVHEGTVLKINENGIVDLFDDTVEQFYSFSLHQRLPIIKAAS